MTVNAADRDASSSSEQENPQSTQVSLLEGIRNQDPQAWQRLVELWTPFVYRYCRKRGLSAQDTEDVTQTILVRVFQGLSSFRRDGRGQRLRYWIAAIMRNELAEHFRRVKRAPIASGGSDHQKWMDQQFEAEDASVDGDSWCEPAQVLARALSSLRVTVQPNVWKAFELVEFRKLTAKEAASQLNMTEVGVRQAAFRIRQRLKIELDGMLD